MGILNTSSIRAGASGQGGAAPTPSAFYSYQIEQSARFDSADSSSLSSNHFSSANRKKFTFSFWFKRSLESDSSYPMAFVTGNSSNNQIAIYQGKLYQQVSYNLFSTGLYRDFNGWYHGVYAYDIDNSTADYRLRIYINGTEITDFGTNQRSSFSGDTNFNTGTNYIGRNPQNTATHYDGYLAEFIMIEGQQLSPSSFGETKNGVWIPKDPSSLTFGSNGYYLKFNNTGQGIFPSSVTVGGASADSPSTGTINLFSNIGAANPPANRTQLGQGTLNYSIDLGSAKTLGAWLGQGHQSSGYATRTATGTVSYSDDNSSFTSLGSSTYTFGNGVAANGHTWTPRSHRYWKIEFPSASGGDGVSGYQIGGFFLGAAQSTTIADLGADSSGNGNNFTVTNMGADHQVLDSPTFGS